MNSTVSNPGAGAGREADAAERPALLGLLLVSGVAGPVLFVVSVLVQGATRPGYNAWHHPVSDLALGPQGWLQTATFILTGVLVLAFAAGLRWALHPGAGATWAPILIGVTGLGLVAAAFFPTDPGATRPMPPPPRPSTARST